MNATIFRSEDYDKYIDTPFTDVEIKTGAQLLARYERYADDDRYTVYKRVASDSALDPNAKYQVTYICEDVTELSSWYIELEIKKLD